MNLPVRKRIRLQNYDYSSDGYYFVTICTRYMRKLFGEIIDTSGNTVQLTTLGKIVDKHIKEIARHYDNVHVDKYVIMPNHIHLIVVIGCDNSIGFQPPNLSYVIGLFKSGVSREIKKQIWQNRFHDHVIRDEKAYLKIWNYIDTNPLLWEKDKFFVW